MIHDLHSEWSQKNSGSLDDYSKFSNRKAWWTCTKGHEWEEVIANRRRMSIGCPFCSGRRACHENCLATVRPDLCGQWGDRNELSPSEVTSGTHKKVWWTCEKGHEWQASIVKRAKDNRGCPYCANQKVGQDNNLLHLFPELSREWHPTKNGRSTPADIVPGSCLQVWWLCNCGFSWKTAPSKRTRQNTGCPICKASRGERAIANWLNHECVEFLAQHTFENCRNKFKLPFDFYLPRLRACVEFQGEQHYSPIPYFGGHDKLAKTQLRDRIKKEFCDSEKIKLLIIPYWKIKGMGSILKEFIYG